MPGNARSPDPRRRNGPDQDLGQRQPPQTDTSSVADVPGEDEKDDIAAQLRRRREASWRLPPMPCGHRDPLDCKRAAS